MIAANVKMVKAGVPIGDTKLLRYYSSTLSYTVVEVSCFKPPKFLWDEAEMDEMLAKKYVEFYEFKGIDDVNNRAAR
ncbi:hypothetical protein OUZ56_020679 [Daphnia magna]|uniref:Uncharacterized protein n=1 Tax=Daphnia magna TaxID=35525 RepID=A0ABQ9ZF50_9CRUS|nr:hypothetical protein OUZ56_020679 [Daphnia magna]